MISALSVVVAGFLIGQWAGRAVDGWKAYPIAILAALAVVPAVGYLAVQVDGMLQGGRIAEMRGIAVGLGLAVALIEVPLIVFKRKRRQR